MHKLGLAFLSWLILAAACSSPGEKLSVDPSDDTTPPANEEPADETPLECPHEGPPLVDASTFPPCPQCGGGHCVTTILLPRETAAKFADCDAESKCVPDVIIETKGNFIPPTCSSAFGAEGRCLSRCIDSVEAKADTLPQDSCADTELCVPCFDPFTQQSTGACDQSCDPGPEEPPFELPSCCDGLGLCLPTEDLGDKAEQLAEDNCPQNNGPSLCVPEAFLQEGFQPMSCWDEQVIGDAKPGVCLPNCLPAVQGLLQDLILDQEGCPANHKCAPCDHPITGDPTGACDL